MILFSLHCAQGHKFDGWFASGTRFEEEVALGRVSCPICGDIEVTKSLMAPALSNDSSHQEPPSETRELELAKMRAHIEANSEDVGRKFAQEARAIHDGSAPARQIHGEANLKEARALIEDGVPILPLPFVPKSKMN